MFVLWHRYILERTRSIARCFILCNCLLLLVQAAHGGAYQRTKDGKTLVWNNYPSKDDVASWSGARDASGYATGKGTLTWYQTEKGFRTGSLLPAKGSIVAVSRYSGKMVRGKFNGPVLNVDADGKKFQLTFVDGVKRRDRTPEPTPVPDQQHNEHLSEITAASTPAEGPAPSPTITESPTATPFRGMMAEGESASRPFVAKATPSPSGETPVVEVASIRSPVSSAPPPPVSSTSDGLDSAVRDRIISDFKAETSTVLSQVGEATGNFRGIDRLDSVAKLPTPVSESVGSLVQRARNFRSKIGYETALRECRGETETVDALSAVDQVTRSIAGNDVSDANSKLTDFLKNNPEPVGDSEKPLWQYLASMRQVCSRLEKDADTHLQRAQSLAAAGRPSEAIREYQEAYRMFPNPATAEKIRQLQTNSLGL
jgi:hypothetical protein